MMKRFYTYAAIMIAVSSACFAQNNPPPAQPTTYDCPGKLYNVSPKDTFKLPAALIEYCQQRGWDPPGKEYENKSWQPYGGKPVRTGTAGSVATGAKQSPDVPPGASATGRAAAGGNRSAALSAMPSGSGNLCINFRGQRTCPRCNLVNGQNRCEIPVLDPTSGDIVYRPAGDAQSEAEAITPANPLVADVGGTFGRITPISPGSATLQCGGTMTISNAEVSSVVGATHLAIVQELSRDVRVYRLSGSSFHYLHTVRLGRDLCGVNDDERTRPSNQFLFFSAAQPEVAIRVVQPLEEAQEQAQEPIVYNTADDEKYVVIRSNTLIAGRGNPPSCEPFRRYPKTIVDLRIIPPEASEDITRQLPLSAPPCNDHVLHLDLTTPNLVHQPGANVRMLGITPDRFESAVLSTPVSALYYQPRTILRLGAAGPFTLQGDAMIQLPDRSTLHLYGPATIAGGQIPGITLTRGGHIEDEEGVIRQRIPAGTSNYIPPGGITPPYYVITDEKIYLPPGLTLLTTRGGLIREPAAPPPP